MTGTVKVAVEKAAHSKVVSSSKHHACLWDSQCCVQSRALMTDDTRGALHGTQNWQKEQALNLKRESVACK